MTGTPSVAVIGAGVCGASAARVLVDAGLRVVVHDKARAAGGALPMAAMTVRTTP